MAKAITAVNTAADTFQVLINRTNEIANAVSTEVVTANNDANGALTTGNAQLAGTLSVLVLAANTVRGGNVQSTLAMNVVSNVNIWQTNILTIGNSTVNTIANSTTVTAANVVGTRVSSGANVHVNTTAIHIGNSTVNGEMFAGTITFNRTVGVNTGVATISTGADGMYGLIELGGNVGGYIDIKTPNSDDYDYRIMGNSTGLHVLAGSSTATANQFNITLANISLGTNSIFIAHTTNTVTFSNTLVIGNSTVNVIANNTTFKLSNSTVNTSIRVPTGAEYAATNVFLHANGSWVEATVGSAPNISDTDGLIDMANTTTTGTSAQVINSWTKGSYRAADLFITVIDTGANGYHLTKMLVLSDGSSTDAHATEYGTLISNASLGTFIANCNTTHVKINFTPTVAATTVRMVRTLLSV